MRRLYSLFELFGFFELFQRHGTLEAREVIDEQDAFKMIHLMLQAGREQAFGFQLLPDAVTVQIFRAERQPSSNVANSSDAQEIRGLI